MLKGWEEVGWVARGLSEEVKSNVRCGWPVGASREERFRPSGRLGLRSSESAHAKVLAPQVREPETMWLWEKHSEESGWGPGF